MDRRTFAVTDSYGAVFHRRYRWYERVDYWLVHLAFAAGVTVLPLTAG